jgi:hypothetical protein
LLTVPGITEGGYTFDVVDTISNNNYNEKTLTWSDINFGCQFNPTATESQTEGWYGAWIGYSYLSWPHFSKTAPSHDIQFSYKGEHNILDNLNLVFKVGTQPSKGFMGLSHKASVVTATYSNESPQWFTDSYWFTITLTANFNCTIEGLKTLGLYNSSSFYFETDAS